MCADKNLETVTAPLDGDLESVADSLSDDIVVAGPRAALGAVAGETTGVDQPRVVAIGDETEFAGAVRDVGVVVVALDGHSNDAESVLEVLDDADGFVVVVFSGHEDDVLDPSLLERVGDAADVTLLACRKRAESDFLGKSKQTDKIGDTTVSWARTSRPDVAVSAAFDFVRMIRKAGQINLDLADAQTVLTDRSFAVLGGGTASLEVGGSPRAVRRAFEEMPASIDAARGSAALLSVVGGPEMSIQDATAAVQAVREEVRNIEEVIWGVATDDALGELVTVDLVVDDIMYRLPLSAGDSCPRCGTTLARYTLGERTALSCDDCGFADLPTSLGERVSYDLEL